MLKRNLITIAIITLGLAITSAFGQAADWEIKPAVKNPKAAVKKPIRQSIFTNDTIDKNKMGNFEIQGISEAQQQIDWVKSPCDVSSGQAAGKRQYAPIKRQNLGDTGTHEVGHKQGKRRN